MRTNLQSGLQDHSGEHRGQKFKNPTAQLQSSDQENSSKEENMEEDTAQTPIPASEAKVIY